jgi:predicted phage-related endonuclease
MTLTAQQKTNRLRGVGASEVLAALGQDSRCSRLKLYGRKLGTLSSDDLDSDERVLFGQLLEPVIRKEFARRLGVRVIQRHQTLYHPAVPLLGHVDGWIPTKRCGVEIKTADRFESEEFGDEGSDQVPTRYYIQCSAYMAITDAHEWHLAVLIGGNCFKTYVITRDPQIEAVILDGVRDFWRHVESLTPPDPTTPEDVRIRWPRDLGTTIQATEDVELCVARLRELKSQIAELEAQRDCELVQVQKFMQDHAQLVDRSGDVLATWRAARPSQRLDAKALAADYSALYAQYMREVPGSRRFLLK